MNLSLSRDEWLVGWNGQCPPPVHNFVPLALQRMLIPFTKIPSGHHGQGPLVVHATRLACLPAECATLSILHFPWGKAEGHWALRFMGSHPLLLHQLEISPLHTEAPGG